jgi:hypothetical protein
MPHMIPVYDDMECFLVETSHGTECVPCDLTDEDSLADYLEGKQSPDEIVERKRGIYCRLSAPGYMDCTEWAGPFETIEEAQEHIRDMYDVDPETGEDLEEE